MYFRSFEDLNRCIVSNISKIPQEAELIVGIPRSGLLVANMLALYLNLPFTDLQGFINGRILSCGQRLSDEIRPFDAYRQIVVIDDSILSGHALTNAKAILCEFAGHKNIKYGAVYAAPYSIKNVDFDFYFELCPSPRIFEWNLMHHYYLESFCVDMDGVLCRDPTNEENDDGENYLEFLRNAEPFLRPTRKLGYVVTNRLEKYRAETEEWLKRNKIIYGKLIMCNLPSKQAREKANNYAEMKASVYAYTKSLLFIESSLWQSRRIANISNKPVYCTDVRQMIYPFYSGTIRKVMRPFRRMLDSRMYKLK